MSQHVEALPDHPKAESHHVRAMPDHAKTIPGHVEIADSNATVDGKTIAQWTQDWLRWVAHAPADTPPGTPFGPAVDDIVGSPDYALVDNTGPVFFLYGGDWGTPSSADPTIPTIDVPACKPILVPLINAFDIDGPGIETIPGFVESGRGTYADEARYVTHLAEKSIYEAHLTVTASDGHTVLDLHGPATACLTQDTGTFALGDSLANPSDYIATILGTADNTLPFTEEIGRWAMITGLAPGDYTINFGGKGHAVTDPVTGTALFHGADGGTSDWMTNTTDHLHVG
ncbi:MAG: hypothetical protein ACJ8AI_08230 [Rhodopila sp.]